MRLALLATFLTACSVPTVRERLASPDDAVGREAVREYVARGEAAIPELRQALEDDGELARARAGSALGSITGQWCSDGSLVWRRSLEEALWQDRPILVLQLFGRFDEEFC